jgi:hypothetical protein
MTSTPLLSSTSCTLAAKRNLAFFSSFHLHREDYHLSNYWRFLSWGENVAQPPVQSTAPARTTIHHISCSMVAQAMSALQTALFPYASMDQEGLIADPSLFVNVDFTMLDDFTSHLLCFNSTNCFSHVVSRKSNMRPPRHFTYVSCYRPRSTRKQSHWYARK